ncbi:flagellar biosynthesis anti-sigma factor FlgM [Qipengyuania sp.]|uniref:flagellar biosynthesis anti-sigma factor FlgM n=1 Tax=Qipengyuania sp. TaxID=2004515 RepID=UPI0035C86CC7
MKPIDSVSPGRVPGQVRQIAKTDRSTQVDIRKEATASNTVALPSAGAEAPVDNQRVSEIRDALREGRYPLLPFKIADAMIAAKFMLVEKE